MMLWLFCSWNDFGQTSFFKQQAIPVMLRQLLFLLAVSLRLAFKELSGTFVRSCVTSLGRTFEAGLLEGSACWEGWPAGSREVLQLLSSSYPRSPRGTQWHSGRMSLRSQCVAVCACHRSSFRSPVKEPLQQMKVCWADGTGECSSCSRQIYGQTVCWRR